MEQRWSLSRSLCGKLRYLIYQEGAIFLEDEREQPLAK